MSQINPIAQELNEIIKAGNPHLMEMLSKMGRRLYFPKGILTQSAEARQKAYDKFNATIGIATENRRTMCLPTVMSYLNKDKIRPSESLTYAPSFGIFGLRQLWKEKMYEKNPSLKGKTISLPVVTNGITHGINVFADLFIDPDDVVIFPDKMWGNNTLILSVRKDAYIDQYPLFSTDGGFNIKGFKDIITKNAHNNYKIVVFLNFPNNPTGYSTTEPEGEKIVEILHDTANAGTNVIAVTDDAYFGLNYDDEIMKESLFARLCDCHPRLLAVKMDGATKEMFVWGLRVGFITYGTVIYGDQPLFYEALEKKTAGNIRGSVSNVGHLSQSIVFKSLTSPDLQKERTEKIEILKQRAVEVKTVAKNPKFQDAWDVYPFNSGYFMCLRLKKAKAEAARIRLLDEYKVGVIATSDTDLRITFSSIDIENIAPMFEYIYKAVKDVISE